MINLLSRAYSIGFKNRIVNCNNIDDLIQMYNELLIIQNSIIWNENQEILKSLESYRLFDEMRNLFTTKTTSLGISNEKFSSLYANPSQLLEKFKFEETELKKIHSETLTTQAK